MLFTAIAYIKFRMSISRNLKVWINFDFSFQGTKNYGGLLGNLCSFCTCLGY